MGWAHNSDMEIMMDIWECTWLGFHSYQSEKTPQVLSWPLLPRAVLPSVPACFDSEKQCYRWLDHFSPQLPVVFGHVLSLMWQRPREPLYRKLQGKWESCLFYLASEWLFWPGGVQFCVCLCHTLLFAWPALVRVSGAGGFVICTALLLSAFAALRWSCGCFLFYGHFLLREQ